MELATLEASRTVVQRMGVQREKLIFLAAVLATVTLIRSPICVRDYNEFLDATQGSAGPFHHAGAFQDTLTLSRTHRINNNANKVTTPAQQIDIGLQALIQNNYPLERVSKILPRQLFLVYGIVGDDIYGSNHCDCLGYS